MSVFDVVVCDLRATKFCKIGASAEFFADIFGEGANISARADVGSDYEFWVVIAYDFDAVDFDFAGGNFEIFVLASKLIGALPIYFYSAEFWGGLSDSANE